MDLARNPSEPDGNPHLADAAPEPARPQIFRREDYRPFGWLVPRTQLHFDLSLDGTRVRSQLTLERNPDAAAEPGILLNGDGLTPLAVSVDGVPCRDWRMEGDDLRIPLVGDAHEVTIDTRLDPSANTQLMGLYASNGMLCTQCEAEGFRRITFFPDRPDVLSTYTVRLEASRGEFPVLLANGNPVEKGTLDGGRHYAVWHDPWPKPSYLFAVVAGDLVARRDRFTTMSGREVDLAIWVRAPDLARTAHAMDSLKRAMRWDEEVFGREYDLDQFNIVAVSDFNMGAMENKGLNIFNTKYVLADAETATDSDFDAIEAVIAHEYFHNWSGNRVTCRDWFQLSLKEGFTVLRDQLFSADMGSAAVKRIEEVRVLRSVQFPEDSGPLAHPIRPDTYREISNFYTATVYNKGAEVIRMVRTMIGPDAFRRGCDLYFDRHDGEAATCEDFVRAMEDASGADLSRFRLWYAQAGTPRVTISCRRTGGTLAVTVAQTVPPTPGQPVKQPMVVPLRVAVFSRESGRRGAEELLVTDRAEATFTLPPPEGDAVLSVNRGFTAPVIVQRAVAQEDLLFLARHDDDPFARSEAVQELVVGHLVGVVEGRLDTRSAAAGRDAIAQLFGAILSDARIDDLMRAELLTLPGETYLSEQVERADPQRIFDAREALKAHLGTVLWTAMAGTHARCAAAADGFDAPAKGGRRLRSLLLTFAAAARPGEGADLAWAQYQAATTMTDRQGALMVLAGLRHPTRTHALLDFYTRFRDNPLVIDKWFAIQAMSLHPEVTHHVEALAAHPAFSLANPNRVRALFMSFTTTAAGFHAADGSGYRLIADLVRRLDPVNPQTAARFVPQLGRWRRFEPGRAALMRAELERIVRTPGLSRDTAEQVDRALD
ncbi:aminopeptidase N [Erythrobacteraceae bacterium CFH 75059]|uniref:aminopeptidase N n=1 Tax=Qipengyuania thermophila TaxID=2509361 RepID=UPI0010212390|nr:aminopeptidase N [Qipengyuania thermophila]TCD06763.1 aminopeptidase N [Erythrobacteraceae bacterium CFH 75059]